MFWWNIHMVINYLIFVLFETWRKFPIAEKIFQLRKAREINTKVKVSCSVNILATINSRLWGWGIGVVEFSREAKVSVHVLVDVLFWLMSFFHFLNFFYNKLVSDFLHSICENWFQTSSEISHLICTAINFWWKIFFKAVEFCSLKRGFLVGFSWCSVGKEALLLRWAHVVVWKIFLGV